VVAEDDAVHAGLGAGAQEFVLDEPAHLRRVGQLGMLALEESLARRVGIGVVEVVVRLDQRTEVAGRPVAVGDHAVPRLVPRVVGAVLLGGGVGPLLGDLQQQDGAAASQGRVASQEKGAGELGQRALDVAEVEVVRVDGDEVIGIALVLAAGPSSGNSPEVRSPLAKSFDG